MRSAFSRNRYRAVFALVALLVFAAGTLTFGLQKSAQAAEAPTTVMVSSEDDLIKYLASPAILIQGKYKFVLTADISITRRLAIPDGADVQLVSQGKHQITYNIPDKEKATTHQSMFLVMRGGKFTIGESGANSATNLIVFQGNDRPIKTRSIGEFVSIWGDAVIENAEVTGAHTIGEFSAPFYVAGGTLTVNNANFHDNTFSFATSEGAESSEPIEVIAPELAFARSAGIAVSEDGLVTINGGTFEHNTAKIAPGSGVKHVGLPGVLAISHAKMLINGGNFSSNSGSRGGVGYIGPKSALTINGGTFSSNAASDAGGAFYQDYDSTLIINGGTFKKNTSRIGAAIAATDTYREVTEKNPQPQEIFPLITDGEKASKDFWSAVFAEQGTFTFKQWKEYGLGATFELHGGDFEGNEASVAGGALYLSTDATMSGGRFIQNSARQFGGAIYLASVPHSIHMSNVYLGNNHATNSAPDASWTVNDQEIALKSASGGGIWYGPTGDSKTHINNGVVFDNNHAEHDGDDFASVAKRKAADPAQDHDLDANKDFYVTPPSYALGGIKQAWYQDGNPVDLSVPRYKQGAQPFVAAERSQKPLSLKARSAGDVRDFATSLSKLVISDNTSARGGGIATNGKIIFGDDDESLDVTVATKWTDKVPAADYAKKSVSVHLMNVSDPAHPQLLTTLELSAANNWKATIKNLPREAASAPIRYELVQDTSAFAPEKFVVSASATGDGALAKDASAYIDTSKISSSESPVDVVFTNDPVEAPQPAPTPAPVAPAPVAPAPGTPAPVAPGAPTTPAPSTKPQKPASEKPAQQEPVESSGKKGSVSSEKLATPASSTARRLVPKATEPQVPDTSDSNSAIILAVVSIAGLTLFGFGLYTRRKTA